MAETIERIYTIPLRKEWLKEPRAKRSNRAIRTVKLFVKKHTKAEDVKISKGVNELIFARGFKKPPGKIKIEVKGDPMKVTAKLPGEVIIEKDEKKTGVAALKDRLTGKSGEAKKDELKSKLEEKVKEATSDEKVKEAIEKVKKQEAEEKKAKEKKVKKEEKK